MTDPVSGFREVETKLRVHALFRLPDLSETEGSGVFRVDTHPVVTMDATYYDSVDLRLFRSRMTLRRRQGGADEGWHLKLPVDGEAASVRDELHVPLGTLHRVPSSLHDLVLATTRGADLVPVAKLRTVRSPYDLYDANGVHLAELVDDTVSVLVDSPDGGERTAERFRELEVEVRDGSPQSVAAVVNALLAAGAVPGGVSKAAHALGPAASASPDVPEPSAVGPHDPSVRVIAAHLQRYTRELLRQDLRVRRGLPDSVHQFRVAARRLRSGLQVFGPLLDVSVTNPIRAELGWVASQFGVARDTEVLLERLTRHARDLGEPDAGRAMSVLGPALTKREEQAEAAGTEIMTSDRYLVLLDNLVSIARQPPVNGAAELSAAEALPPLVERAWRRLRRHVADLEVDGAAEPWHEARIAAKKARYATEAVIPALGAPAKERAESLAAITDILGTHQDAFVAQTFLRDIAIRAASGAPVSPPVAFALGRLVGVEWAYEMADRDRFADVWSRARKVHRRNALADL